MMWAGILLLIGCLIAYSSPAQQEVLSNIPVKGKDYKKFIPKGYALLEDAVIGDLNGDGLEDMALALYDTLLEAKDADVNRILLVLFKDKDGYRLTGKSDQLLLRKGGIFNEPITGLEIKSGILIVTNYGGSAWRFLNTKKFRFQKDAFYLIGQTTDSYWNVSDCDGEGVGDAGRKYKDINLVTGDMEEIERDEDCKLKKNERGKLKKQPLVKLEDYRDDNRN